MRKTEIGLDKGAFIVNRRLQISNGISILTNGTSKSGNIVILPNFTRLTFNW